MNRNFYTADLHLGHAAILKHCSRPFPSVDAMDAHILKTLQAMVGPKDNLWIVGDFAYRTKTDVQTYFEKIPGQKHLVTGNHDDKKIQRLGWASIRDMGLVKDGKDRFYLCHYPMMTWPGSRYGTLHLFGHVHNHFAGTDRSMNVGVDHWDFAPADKDSIAARVKTQSKMPLWDVLEPGT